MGEPRLSSLAASSLANPTAIYQIGPVYLRCVFIAVSLCNHTCQFVVPRSQSKHGKVFHHGSELKHKMKLLTLKDDDDALEYKIIMKQ